MTHRLPLSREEADRRLLESYKAGDEARPNPRHAGEWLVSSKTHSSDTLRVWYRVTLDDDAGTRNSCGCEGFRFRGMCRHLVRAHWEQHQLNLKARKEARHEMAVLSA